MGLRRSARVAAKRARKAEKAEAKRLRKAADRAKKADRKARKAAAEAAKSDAKASKKAAKVTKKAVQQSEKAHAEVVARAEAKAAKPTLVASITDPKTARRAVAAAKIAGPALAPFALKAATSIRGYLDRTRAAKLGVSVDHVAEYAGPTGAVAARVDGLQHSVGELRERRHGDLQALTFARHADQQLTDLGAAVRASAPMPAPRRRAALDLVAGQLDLLESQLMSYLVKGR